MKYILLTFLLVGCASTPSQPKAYDCTFLDPMAGRLYLMIGATSTKQAMHLTQIFYNDAKDIQCEEL